MIKIVTWECHVDNSTEFRYDMILGKELLTDLVLDLNISKHAITGGGRPHGICMAPVVDMSKFNYDSLNLKDNVKLEESFSDAYVEEVLKYENVRSSTKILNTVLYEKYDKTYLNKFMKY